MQRFFVVIGKESMSIYGVNGGSLEKLYLEGNPAFAYSVNHAGDCAEGLIRQLADEYNLDSVGEVDLIVVNNEDAIIADVMGKALHEYIRQEIGIEELIGKVLRNMSRDRKLCIEQYGVNFDGKNYRLMGQKTVKSEFSLLGYTITDDQLIKYVG